MSAERSSVVGWLSLGIGLLWLGLTVFGSSTGDWVSSFGVGLVFAAGGLTSLIQTRLRLRGIPAVAVWKLPRLIQSVTAYERRLILTEFLLTTAILFVAAYWLVSHVWLLVSSH
jgi:hypothetical protein